MPSGQRPDPAGGAAPAIFFAFSFNADFARLTVFSDNPCACAALKILVTSNRPFLRGFLEQLLRIFERRLLLVARLCNEFVRSEGGRFGPSDAGYVVTSRLQGKRDGARLFSQVRLHVCQNLAGHGLAGIAADQKHRSGGKGGYPYRTASPI